MKKTILYILFFTIQFSILQSSNKKNKQQVINPEEIQKEIQTIDQKLKEIENGLKSSKTNKFQMRIARKKAEEALKKIKKSNE
jgi:hypothetical protein